MLDPTKAANLPADALETRTPDWLSGGEKVETYSTQPGAPGDGPGVEYVENSVSAFHSVEGAV